MNLLFKPAAVLAFGVLSLFNFSKSKELPLNDTRVFQHNPNPKIQVAVILDVSGSMDGLIEQAKAQLWNMVTTLGRAQCNNNTGAPQIELALYEYGRTDNDAAKGYIKQLSPFTNDLDEVSKILFSLRTNGGDEYCGQVIYTSMDELKWDTSSQNYKVIFIAGNEDFLQGKLKYTEACDKANAKGVIVNTIYCGDRQQGIREHWNLAGECGNGSFTNINQNAKEPDIPTPYDSTLIVLNGKLNTTYIGYGYYGAANTLRQEEVDKFNYKLSPSAGAKRTAAKAKSNVYANSTWDLVDAVKADSAYYSKVDMKTLPDSLKNKTRDQLQQLIKIKAAERSVIQKEIETANTSREKYIAAEKAKAVVKNNEQTLETEVEKIIKQQARRFNMIID
jgi:hypothetical protein